MCERIHRPDIWTQRSDQNAARPLARRGPSTYGSRRARMAQSKVRRIPMTRGRTNRVHFRIRKFGAEFDGISHMKSRSHWAKERGFYLRNVGEGGSIWRRGSF